MKEFEWIYTLLIIVFILDKTVFRKKRHVKRKTANKGFYTNPGIFFPGDYQRASFLTAEGI